MLLCSDGCYTCTFTLPYARFTPLSHTHTQIINLIASAVSAMMFFHLTKTSFTPPIVYKNQLLSVASSNRRGKLLRSVKEGWEEVRGVHEERGGGVQKEGRVTVESWWSSARLTTAKLIRSCRINREQQKQKRLKTEKRAFYFEINWERQTEKDRNKQRRGDWQRGRWVKKFHLVFCSNVTIFYLIL